jgi:hypothetical protein
MESPFNSWSSWDETPKEIIDARGGRTKIKTSKAVFRAFLLGICNQWAHKKLPNTTQKLIPK